MIFATFHSTSTVLAFSATNGTPINESFLATNITLNEPRGIYFDGAGNLYVIDGYKNSSAVYLYPKTSSSPPYGPGATLISQSQKHANSINHPFALVFDSSGSPSLCYVSNQDSNVVAAFSIDISDLSKPSSKSQPPASYLTGLFPKGEFLDGTLVASAMGPLPHVPGNPTLVPGKDGGLSVVMGPDTGSSTSQADTASSGSKDPVKYKVLHSVRDLALVNGVLLVVDEAAGLVRMYQATTGKYYGSSKVAGAPGAILDSPTHLLLVGSDTVYVSFSSHIYKGTLEVDSSGTPSLSLAPFFHLGSGSIAGLAVDPSGDFYMANRTGKEILAYSPSNWTSPFWTASVTDSPEFLLYVPASS
jgi:hypothetical protein